MTADIDKFDLFISEQVARLADACNSIDSGKGYQAQSAATVLYNLTEDCPRNPIWATWTGSKADIFVSTARRPNKKDLMVQHSLVSIGGYPFAGFSPLGWGNNIRNFQKLSTWKKEIVIYHVDNMFMTRAFLINQIRNRDGASHGKIGEFDESYALLKKYPSLKWEILDHEDKPVDLKVNAIQATVRQIAHEVIFSLFPLIRKENREIIDYEMNWVCGEKDPENLFSKNFKSFSVQVLPFGLY